MRYRQLIALLCFLPPASWAQIRIDHASVQFRNIPVMHSVLNPNISAQTREVKTFGYSASSMTVDSNYCHGGGLYFRIDTVRRRLYNFGYSFYSEEDLGRDRKAWVLKSVVFDSIALFPDGNVYRGKMNGAMLAVAHVKISEGSYHEYAVGFTGEDSYNSIDTAFSDTSEVEVILKGFPMEVPSATQPKIQVYPNPATIYLTIEGLSPNNVTILDQLGRIQQLPIISTSPHLQLDVSTLPAGCHWIRVSGQIHKFIKH